VPDDDTILLIGTKEQVEDAKKMIEETIERISNTEEREISVPIEHHAKFKERRGALVQRICRECGDIVISFSRADSNSDKVR